jgi:hypothetical protein
MPMASKVHSTPSARQTGVPRRRILLCYDGSAEAKHVLERFGEMASVDLGQEQSHGRVLEEALRASGQSGGDVLARFAQALRGVRACESSVSHVMCHTLDLLGGSMFVLDEKGLTHVADAPDQRPLLD